MIRCIWIVLVCSVFTSSLRAQMSVSDVLQECDVSAETLTIIDCGGSDLDQLVASVQDNLTGMQELHARRVEWLQAKAVKKQILDQLGGQEHVSDYESTLVSLREASAAEELAQDLYRAYIDLIREDLIEHLTEEQKRKFRLVIRSYVQVLPPEYRVLDLNSRQVIHLARALRESASEELSQHPLITEAESSFDVQYARQMLLVHLDEMESLFSDM